MCMQDVTFQSQPSLTPSQIADLRLAASKLTGPARRSFEAEMTLKYCEGNPLKAEAVFGWGASYGGAWLGRKTKRDHLSGGAIGFQWSQTLGRAASAGRASPLSTGGCSCAARPDFSHEFDLHAPDCPIGVKSSERTGLWRGGTCPRPVRWLRFSIAMAIAYVRL